MSKLLHFSKEPGLRGFELFDQGRDVLSKFGYRYHEAGDWFEDWDEMWALLKGDFVLPSGKPVPDFAELDEGRKSAARDYMEMRLTADRRLVACEQAHKALLRDGLNTDLVELYTAARESYEDTVMAFGEARETLAALL